MLFLESAPELPAYQELRAGFTAAVSHELRTPLARLLVAARERDAAGLRRRGADGAGAAGGRAGAGADRRRPLPRRARDRSRGRLARTHARRSRSWRRSSPRSRSARTMRRSRSRSRADAGVALPLRPRMLRVVVENLLANSIRYAGPGEHVPDRALESARGAAGRGLGRRQGRSARRSAAPVRALLPRRPGANEPRHGPRPRDREARRHVRGRRSRGDERARPGPRGACPFPATESRTRPSPK